MAKAKKKEEVMFDFEEAIKEEVKEEPKPEPKPKKVAPKKEAPKTIRVETPSNFNEKDLIPCKSVTSGGLSFIGASGKKYRFSDYGAVEYVEFGDLRREAQVVNSTNYLYYPRFIVIDPEFVEQFPKLEEFYSQFYTDEGDFDKILDLPKNQMKEAVEKLPKGCKEALKGIVATKLDDGVLDSVQKIKMLDEVLGTNMLLMLANN